VAVRRGSFRRTERWKEANTVGAYVVLKVFGGYRDCPAQPDGWHQYGPAVARDDQSPFSSFNEWGEGTSVESAEEWATASGYGTYLDILHRYPQR
jgi:hypothetical protein